MKKNKRRVLSQADVNKRLHSSRLVSFEDTILENIVFPSITDHLNFRNAILRNVDFSCNTRSGCDFTRATIECCNFRYARMQYSEFLASTIKNSDFSEANLRGSIFARSSILNSKFVKSDLHQTDIGSIACQDRLLGKLNDFTDALYFQRVPTEGSFIGWKEACIQRTMFGDLTSIPFFFLVKLLIPEDAKRSSAFGIKCRCNKAVVLDIFKLNGRPTEVKTVHSIHDYDFVYEKGKTVEVPDFDDCWWHECSTGIHFFLDKEAAMLYSEMNL